MSGLGFNSEAMPVLLGSQSKSSFMSYVGISIQGNIRDCVSLFDKERGF